MPKSLRVEQGGNEIQVQHPTDDRETNIASAATRGRRNPPGATSGRGVRAGRGRSQQLNHRSNAEASHGRKGKRGGGPGLAAQRNAEAAEREQQAQQEQDSRQLVVMRLISRKRAEIEAQTSAIEIARQEQLMREEAAARARQAQQELLAAEQAEQRELDRLDRLSRQEAAQKRRRDEQEARKVEVARQEASFTSKHVLLGSSLVTCGAGIDIRRVISGFESCRLTVKNLPRDAKITEIADLFMQQGISPEEFLILGIKGVEAGRYLEAQVLTNAEQGQAIAIGLNGIEFRDTNISFEVTDNPSADAMGESTVNNPEVLTISWFAPSVTMIATFDNMDEVHAKVQMLDKTTWRGRRIKVEMNRPPPPGPAMKYYNPMSIKIMGLVQSTTVADVLELTGAGAARAIKSPLYDLGQVFLDVERHLKLVSDDSMPSFNIVTRGDNLEGSIVVCVRFESWEQAKKAKDSLDRQRLRPEYPFLRLVLPDPLRFVSTISIEQYRAQKQQWDSLAESNTRGSSHLKIQIYENGGVAIRVVGDDKKSVGSLKVRVETLIAGERLDATYWHLSFLSPGGRRILSKISEDSGIFIRSDWKVRALRIYGDRDKKEHARQLLLAEVERLALLEWSVSLKRQSVGYFVRKGLAALKEILGDDAVALDLASNPCKLSIRGGEEARHALSSLLAQSLEGQDIDLIDQEINEICPICYDSISHPIKLGCGHTYCMACIRHYLTSAPETKVFPLACMGDEAQCKVPIPIPVIQRFLSPQKFNHLVNIAFSTYLDRHTQEFQYCTTPDCVQIYRCNAGQALKCPSCFAVVCSVCHEEVHEGMTCAERALHKDPAAQERLNEAWASDNGVKRCPTCRIWIEKTEGCNHMECKCGAHICWICMGIFQPGEIYEHLNQVHGGAFDVPVVDAGALQRQREYDANWREREAERQRQEADNLLQARVNGILEQRRLEAAQIEERRLRVRNLVQQQELERRAEYQRQLDRQQEILAEQRNQTRRGCIVM